MVRPKKTNKQTNKNQQILLFSIAIIFHRAESVNKYKMVNFQRKREQSQTKLEHKDIYGASIRDVSHMSWDELAKDFAKMDSDSKVTISEEVMMHEAKITYVRGLNPATQITVFCCCSPLSRSGTIESVIGQLWEYAQNKVFF